MADEAASRHQYGVQETKVLKKMDDTVDKMIERIIRVRQIILEEREDKEEHIPRAPRVKLRQKLLELGKQQGHQILIGTQVKCLKCGQKELQKDCLAWIQEICPTRSIHGHTIREYKGITFCIKCGYWDQNGGTTSQRAQQTVYEHCQKPQEG